MAIPAVPAARHPGHVTAKLYGVDFGAGKWGQEDLHLHFIVGRAQIVKADVTSHRLVVIRDDKVIMDYPASYGLGSDPNRVTRSGTHIVMSKSPLYLMSNPVEVTGSRVPMSPADGDVYDWTVPWEKWMSMSALH